MTKIKSSIDFQKKIDQLASKNGDNLPSLKEAYQKWDRARKFLKRNEDKSRSPELIEEYKLMIEQNKVLARTYKKKILNLDSKRKREKHELNGIVFDRYSPKQRFDTLSMEVKAKGY